VLLPYRRTTASALGLGIFRRRRFATFGNFCVFRQLLRLSQLFVKLWKEKFEKYNILGQNVPVWAKMCHFGPLCALLCRNVPLCAKMCHFVPKCATLCSFVPKCAKLGQVGPKCAALCRFVPFCATLCQVGPKSLQSSPKDLLIPYYIFLRDKLPRKCLLDRGKPPTHFTQKLQKVTKLHEIYAKLQKWQKFTKRKKSILRKVAKVVRSCRKVQKAARKSQKDRATN
jgi:hypothetical protein